MHKLVVSHNFLSLRIVLSCFLSARFLWMRNSRCKSDVCRWLYNVKLKLSIIDGSTWVWITTAQPCVHAPSIACRGASSSEKLVTENYSFKLSSNMDIVSDTVFMTAFSVCNHMTRRPCWSQNNRILIYMKIELTSRANKQLTGNFYKVCIWKAPRGN